MKTALTFLVLAGLLGCAKNPSPVKEYTLNGEILKLDPSGQLVTVKGQKIEGWMEAMTMDYPVRDKQEFAKLKVGDSLNAKIMVQGTEYWLAAVADAPATSPPAAPSSK